MSVTQQALLMAAAAASVSASAAFLARTSGLDTTHTNAYTALIDGLVADGVWPKLDVLHIYATQNTTTAQLNLVQSSYPATINGAPTFTADRGYTGVGGSTTYLDSGFNPTTAPSPKFTLNSAHLSVWNLTNSNTTVPAVGDSPGTIMITNYVNSVTYCRINCAGSAGDGPNWGTTGHFVGNRSAASGAGCETSYHNGSSGSVTVESSTSLSTRNLYSLGANGSTPSGIGHQQAMFSIGSSLSTTDATNFYNRLRTYMTSVGVP